MEKQRNADPAYVSTTPVQQLPHYLASPVTRYPGGTRGRVRLYPIPEIPPGGDQCPSAKRKTRIGAG